MSWTASASVYISIAPSYTLSVGGLVGGLTTGRPRTHTAVTGTGSVSADIAYARVVETFVGELLAEHVLDAPEAAGGEGGFLGGGGDGSGGCDGQGGAGGEGTEEAGDEGGHCG